VFIEQQLIPLRRDFPRAEDRVGAHHHARKPRSTWRGRPFTGATLTAHHLLYNRNAIFTGGIRPHYYCLPVLKRETHRVALVQAATSGSPKFFLGTDSAPHPAHLKEHASGCAGCYTAMPRMEMYAEAFDAAGALDKLEGFASFHGAGLLWPAAQHRHHHPAREAGRRPRVLPSARPSSSRCAEASIQPVRGPARDGLTLFDENAAFLQCPDALWEALSSKDWPHLFGPLRPLWAQSHLVLFGHALLEKLVCPRKPITAHVYRAQAATHSIADLDVWMAADLSAERLAGKPFAHLPVLGVPGWWSGNDNPDFYSDATVFRQARATHRLAPLSPSPSPPAGREGS
jgi:hypothetical protein